MSLSSICLLGFQRYHNSDTLRVLFLLLIVSLLLGRSIDTISASRMLLQGGTSDGGPQAPLYGWNGRDVVSGHSTRSCHRESSMMHLPILPRG